MPITPLRICLLTHSTLPRGGVVHAIELGDALADAGHSIALCAPDAEARRLFRMPRNTACRFVPVSCHAAQATLSEFVEQRIEDWLSYFADDPAALDYDVFHAQDAISANALATLVERGMIDSFVRTVHHLDDFSDPRLRAWQTRSFVAARQVCCVSDKWRGLLSRDYGIDAALVSNGVDLSRFCPDISMEEDTGTAVIADDVSDGTGPVVLSVGGIESRKNTIGAAAAFASLLAESPAYAKARWLIAGGASLLDHRAYRQAFDTAVAHAGIRDAIELLGPVDDAQMPSLFRCADVLLFPSLTEGFGLVVLEALACGTPVVVSHISPFTEYLNHDAVEWADPLDPVSIAAALHRALDATPQRRAERRAAGLAICRDYGWARSAATHAALYQSLRSTANA